MSKTSVTSPSLVSDHLWLLTSTCTSILIPNHTPWATPHVNFNRSYRLYFIRGKALSFVTLPPSIQHPPPPSCWTCDIPCHSHLIWGQWDMHYLSCFYKWRPSATFPALRFTANGQINRHWKNRLCLLQSAFFLVWQLKLNLTAAGLAQSVERLTAEQEVGGSIPGAGPILRVLK